MPILTVKTVTAPTAHAAAVVETPKDRAPLPPIRVSGRQSDVMLKILETLNRHLVGSEPLPREALVRLLETLAKVLKFPPLPQESLRDFSKRLAVFLETLPPAVRQAVERQLGQRNLAVSIRILTEALKMPSILDASRLPERAFTPLTPGRPLLTQPEIRPATISSIQQKPNQQGLVQQQPTQQQSALQQPGQGRSAGQQQALPAAQPLQQTVSSSILASATFVPDPGILQAVLKKAFGNDDEPVSVPVIATEEHEAGQDAVATVSRQDDGAKREMPRSGDATAAGASARMPAKANSETIPLLRAAAAFLAADPEALSLVTALAGGDIDSRLTTSVAEELGLDLSEPVDVAEPAVLPETIELPDGEDSTEQMPQRPRENEEKPATRATVETRSDRPVEPVKERPAATIASETAAKPSRAEPQQTAPSITRPEPVLQNAVAQIRQALARDDVAGFTGHDLGEWELEHGSTPQTQVATEEAETGRFEPSDDEKVFSQTLKALVEASLPLPDGKIDWNAPETLFGALAGEAADMEADVLFAELKAADDAILPDTTLLTGDIGETAGTSTFEADTLSALLEPPEDGNTARSPLNHASPMDEPTRDAQTPRQPETGIARDAVPFTMIPYLPAKTEGIKAKKEEDEEQSPSAAHDEHGDNRESPEDQENGSNAAPTVGEEDATDEAGDAYDLYRRMGGLG
ncbi:hypothetical protein [Pararhizobium sp. O133]|uniref:hypothetical protein n=1 Tax=Pararhizobium sp. O133 TaxID=3449278 RepID=UPI003F684A4F